MPAYTSGELLEFNPTTGQQVATIAIPNDPAYQGYFYPYGFSIAADGTFWIAQPNSQNIIHLDASYNELASYSTAGVTPESASIGTDGNVYFTGLNGPSGNAIYQLNTTTGAVNYFAFSPTPNLTSTAPAGSGIWTGDTDYAALRFDYSGNFLQQVGFFGTNQAQTDQTGDVLTTNPVYYDLFRFDQFGDYLSSTFVPAPIGLTIWGVDNPNAPPHDTQDYYSFALTAGQSATIVAKSLNGLNVQITLVDGNGNVLATGVGGSSNVTQKIENFVATAGGTYYVEVTGDTGVQYSLTVTRSADFGIQPHNTPGTAQSLTGTNGVLGALDPGGSLTIGASFAGIDFASPNNPCGCLPPDTNAAVGPTQVIETVNEEIRVYDKGTGTVLLDESLTSFFGQGNGGDVYVLYDDVANRWYVTALDGTDTGLLLAISNDSNALDGFLPTYNLNVTGGAGLPDYPKPGFNADAIFVDFNDFATTGDAAIATINKAAAFAGTLQMYISNPEPEFRAMAPAQMNGDTTPGIEWFMSTDGNDISGDTMRVTEMTNYFSTSPTFTYTSIPVAPYRAPVEAVQPGGTWTTFPNTTTYELQYMQRHAGDRHGIRHRRRRLLSIPRASITRSTSSSGTPTLVQQGVIDPGPGVSVQMPSVAIDSHGNLGFTWMEASTTEYVSMWVGALDTIGPLQLLSTRPRAAAFFGDELPDRRLQHPWPSTRPTARPSGRPTSTPATAATHRHLATRNHLVLAAPGRGQRLVLGRCRGRPIAVPCRRPPRPIKAASSRTPPRPRSIGLRHLRQPGRHGHQARRRPQRGFVIHRTVTGQYNIDVYNDPGGAGEYFLSVNTASYASGGVAGQVFNDLKGSGILDARRPRPGQLGSRRLRLQRRLRRLAVDRRVTEISTSRASTRAPTRSTRSCKAAGPRPPRRRRAPSRSRSPRAARFRASQFGNFQDITHQRRGVQRPDRRRFARPGDPGLQGWTIDLLNVRRRLRRHHRHRRQRQLQLHRRRPRHLHGRRELTSRLDPDVPRRLRERTPSPRPAVRMPAACSSATSSSSRSPVRSTTT